MGGIMPLLGSGAEARVSATRERRGFRYCLAVRVAHEGDRHDRRHLLSRKSVTPGRLDNTGPARGAFMFTSRD
jgi:hypothetical protein